MANAKLSDSPTHFSDSELNQVYSQMLKFALLQLKDQQLAEDAVQEAFYAALKHSDKFKGLSTFKTWVFAILKHKIIDILRNEKRYTTVSDLVENEDKNEDFFDQQEHWCADFVPQPLPYAEQQVKSEQFWLIFNCCLDNLPAQQAKVFMMREFLELDSHLICDLENLTVSNLNVSLYRARVKLQHCLTRKGLTQL